MDYKIEIPKDVKSIIKTLQENGYEAYIVGGCVRDSILKRNPNDFDITTNAKPDNVINLFDKVILTGIQHGTVTVVLNGENFEITTYRTESEYADNRHPSKVEFVSSLKEDLARRDFTINAMAYNEEGKLKDYFNGLVDLQNKIIKTVGNPETRFNEDALRMIRAIRFSAQLNFEIEKNTFDSIKKLNGNIKNISKERIREEFNKILLSNPRSIDLLKKSNLLQYIIPDLDKSYGYITNGKYDKYDLYEHSILSAQMIENDMQLKLAMIFHDMGKLYLKNEEDCDEICKRSADIAKSTLKDLRYDNETINNVGKLITYSHFNMSNDYKIKIVLNEIGEKLTRKLIKVKYANILSENKIYSKDRINNLEIIEKNIDRIINEEECYNLNKLNIDGKELLELGFDKGKQIGEVLNDLLNEVMKNNDLNQKDTLKEMAKRELNGKETLGGKDMKDVVNFMEVFVEEHLDIILNETDGCKCEQCKKDMMAIALNNLKPKYCTTYFGEVMTKLQSIELQQEANILIEISKAVKMVQDSPKHKCEK